MEFFCATKFNRHAYAYALFLLNNCCKKKEKLCNPIKNRVIVLPLSGSNVHREDAKSRPIRVATANGAKVFLIAPRGYSLYEQIYFMFGNYSPLYGVREGDSSMFS